MATMAGPRKSVSIHDYPEHLNPFHEEDHHKTLRFWTIGKKLNRSNSINFSGIKDLKNSWAFRSFMKKGKNTERTKPTPTQESTTNHTNGESSPIVFRRALQYSSMSRSTLASPNQNERYVYGGSITPLPRSRFQERLRSTSHYEVNSISGTPRMARSEVTGSRLSVESNNPFDEYPVPPVRASRRKKKRAPPPPQVEADVTVSSCDNSELKITEEDVTDENKQQKDVDIEEPICNIELKIVEDDDVVIRKKEINADPAITEPKSEIVNIKHDEKNKEEQSKINGDTENNNNEPVDKEFPKVDINKYRRNSSVNENDIRLRRDNVDDFHPLSTKRSKSFTNTLDSTYVSYDIDVNENCTVKDTNCNNEPQKVICKLYNEIESPRRLSKENSISSTEKEFIEIDKATREFEIEISKLTSALTDEKDLPAMGNRLSVSDIRKKFDKSDVSSPNPIPKPRRSHFGGSLSPVNGNLNI